jgi:ubiquinone/menaquinone biosynthesis C-methylase UbiE
MNKYMAEQNSNKESNFVFDPGLKFLNPEKILFQAGLSAGQTMADLGAGNGFYSLAASKLVGENGSVFAVDILEDALEHIATEARLKGARNIQTIRCDLEQPHACDKISTGAMDMVLLSNIVHEVHESKVLFDEAFRMLKTGGKLVVVEWNDQPGPIGPEFKKRVMSDRVKKLAFDRTFKDGGAVSTDVYHYGLIFIK